MLYMHVNLNGCGRGQEWWFSREREREREMIGGSDLWESEQVGK